MTADVAYETLHAEAMKRGLIPFESSALWPREYASTDAETACKFIFGHVYTYDEASGTDQPIEESDYLREVASDWYAGVTTGDPYHFVKSRRMIVSWFCGALELHYAGCKRAKVGISAAAFQGAGGSEGYVWRAAFMYRQLRARNPAWKLPAPTVESLSAKEAMELFAIANGSQFLPLNSDPDKVQGAGCTITRAEELATYRQPARTWSQFRAINQGRPGEKGGFTYSIANVSESDEYAELIQPDPKPDWWDDRLLQYGEYLRLSNGKVKTVSLHFACDPKKQSEEWFKDATSGMDADFIDQQYHGIRNNVAGERVISNYDPSYHCQDLIFPRTNHIGRIVTGWDVGSTLSPAFVLLHIEPELGQIHAIAEYVPDVGMAMSEFAPSVSQLLDSKWISWRAIQPMFLNESDPAGKFGSGTGDGKSAIQTAITKGWKLSPAYTNDIDKRVGIVQTAFLEWIEEGVPRLLVDRNKCPRLHAALWKNYVYDDNKLKGDSRILKTPKKDRASDIVDAFGYALLKAMALVHAGKSGRTQRGSYRRS